jgi:carbonic anhydrase
MAPTDPDEALERLLEGNARFAADRKLNHGHGADRRSELAGGQAPHAIVLGCADSRVPPEVIFDAGLGELFVVRVAGNTAASAAVLGSIEFAITQLGVRLLLVLGHEACGAVAGAVAATDGAEAPGAIGDVVAPIVPVAAEIAAAEPGLSPDELLDRTVRSNVAAVVADLTDRLGPEAARVAGGVYRLESGRVELVT